MHRSAEQIYCDYQARFGALVKALTVGAPAPHDQCTPASCAHGDLASLQCCLLGTIRCSSLTILHVGDPLEARLLAHAEVDDFYEQCDPERENLCLYGELVTTKHKLAGWIDPCRLVWQDVLWCSMHVTFCMLKAAAMLRCECGLTGVAWPRRTCLVCWQASQTDLGRWICQRRRCLQSCRSHV